MNILNTERLAMLPVSTSLWLLPKNKQWQTLRYNRSPCEVQGQGYVFLQECPYAHGFVCYLSLAVPMLLSPWRQILFILASRVIAILIDMFQMISL